MAGSTNLSKREWEVAELLLEGKSNKQIALALGITESTVEFHLSNVYLKLQVHSRAEAILKLGKATGLITAHPGESIVEKEGEIGHTGGELISISRKDGEMERRWRYYFLAGLIFGALYWHYLSAASHFLGPIFINTAAEESPLTGWAIISISLLVYFGVWLLPAAFPAIYEFRHSRAIRPSVSAVILVWISAVLGYYLNYLVLLAFVGLPNMEYYLVFGQRGSGFWQDWAALFPKLILFNFLKWSVVGILAGGLTGLVTSWLYSIWVKKGSTVLPA